MTDTPSRPGTSPWQALHDIRDQMDRVFSSAFGSGQRLTEWSPPVDITEHNGEIVLTAELPGAKKEDVSVELENNVLTIRGEKRQERKVEEEHRYAYERQYGSFTRSFTLPHAVDPDRIRASFENGVLTVTMPKSQEAQGKRIPLD